MVPRYLSNNESCVRAFTLLRIAQMDYEATRMHGSRTRPIYFCGAHVGSL